MTRLEEIKATHSLVDLVEMAGVKLNGQGRVRQGLCPFHDEKSGSFTVYTDTQRFYCFGCGAKGDVIDFVQMHLNVPFTQALDYMSGMPASVVHHTPAPIADRVELDPNILTHAMRFYVSELRGAGQAVEYLEGRGIDRKTMIRLGLGYGAGPGLRDYLISGGYTFNEVRASGLHTTNGAERFSNMIVVPEVVDRLVIYMTGRAISDRQTPRFQGLPGSRPLLGFGRLQQHRWVILTEGVFDWLLLTTWGYPACATMGAQNANQVAAALKDIEYVLLVFDNDRAGQESASLIAAALTQKYFLVMLPDDVKDVADMAKRPGSRDKFHQAVIDAINAKF